MLIRFLDELYRLFYETDAYQKVMTYCSVQCTCTYIALYFDIHETIFIFWQVKWILQNVLKFMFSKKATKTEKIFTVDLTPT